MNPFWATSRGISRSLGWVARLGIIVLAGALLATAVIAGIAPRAWSLANAHDELPVELPPWEDLAQRTYVYDRYGSQIAVYQLENSQPVSISQVPQNVIRAFLAVEDRTFFDHDGVNIRSLVRAVLSNAEGGSARQGASTITQQVVKVEYLAGLERDGRYKILQAHYALMLEREKTKSEILERYLNTIYFGNNAYGIQAASEVYFGVPVEQLSQIQGAFLAGLVQAPTSYDPIRRPEFSQRRFDQVVQALVDTDLITEDEAKTLTDPDDLNHFPLPDKVQSFGEDGENTRTFYTEAVKDYLLNRSDILGDTVQERYNRLFRGGLRIYTTLDPKVQEADDAARATLPQNTKGVETALVSLDSKTGAIRAMTSGKDFQAGVNEINLTLNPRQTGSSIKMFILAAAIQAGAQSNDLIDGPSTCQLPNPGNNKEPVFDVSGVGAGLGTLQQMTAKSINCAYVRLAQIVGLQRNVDTQLAAMDNPYLRERQADPNLADEKKVRPIASMGTGNNEMSPLDMASGAQTIANYGVHHEPYYVERIDGPSGTVYVHDDPGTRVFDAATAERTIDVLKTVITEGTANNNDLAGRTSAGKTGTQDNNTNVWFVGFTPELTTAVWIGNPDQGDFRMTSSNLPEFGRNVQGGRFAAPIWKVAMDAALAGVPASDWSPAPAYPRPASRLYLPGTECVYQSVTRVVEPDPNAETVPPETGPDGATVPTEPTVPVTVAQLVPVPDTGTTVPQFEHVNPTAPLPTTPNTATGFTITQCGRGGTVLTTTTTAAGG